MIKVNDVYKRYQTDHGPGKWVLEGVSFTVPANTNVGLVGRNGAGKSTLLRIIGGTDIPTRGTVERFCRVSWPMGFGGGLQGSLSGRQNAKFVCRIHGHEDDIRDRLAFIQDFAELGDAFDEPIKTYSSGMQARLKFAMSLAFDFDVYISDELTAVGDTAFRKKAQAAFQKLVGRAGLIMVSHQENTLKEFCTAGIWLNDRQAFWFDKLEDALQAYRESQGAEPEENSQSLKAKVEAVDMTSLRKAAQTITQGLAGETVTVSHARGLLLIRQAPKLGLELVPKSKLRKEGYVLRAGAKPVVRVTMREGHTELYELNSQCQKAETKAHV